MCGIAGELALDRIVDSHSAYLTAMSDTLRRRGPDQSGIKTDRLQAVGLSLLIKGKCTSE